MDILVAAEITGLAIVLEGLYPGMSGVTVMTDGNRVVQRLTDDEPLAAVIVNNALRPTTDRNNKPESAEKTLWSVVYLASQRKIPVFMVLPERSYAPDILRNLQMTTEQTTGAFYLHPQNPGLGDIKTLIAWIVQRLPRRTGVNQLWLTPLTAKGGSGKSTQIVQMAADFHRRGYATLVIDGDISNGALRSHFKVPLGEAKSYLTLRDDFPQPVRTYPAEAVQRRIYTHSSGVNLLLSGAALQEANDMNRDAMIAMLDTVRTLPYEVVLIDSGTDHKARTYALDVVAQGGFGVVLAQPGRVFQQGASTMLRLMSDQMLPNQNAAAITRVGLVSIQPEPGSIANAERVHRALLLQYPECTDLGVLPRDQRLLSVLEEDRQWRSAAEYAPRSPYVRAVQAMVDTVITTTHLPPPRAEALTMATSGTKNPWWRTLLRLPAPDALKEGTL